EIARRRRAASARIVTIFARLRRGLPVGAIIENAVAGGMGGHAGQCQQKRREKTRQQFSRENHLSVTGGAACWRIDMERDLTDDAPFHAIAEANEAAALDQIILDLALAAVAEDGAADAIAARNELGTIGAKADFLDRFEMVELEPLQGIPISGIIEGRGDDLQSPRILTCRQIAGIGNGPVFGRER